MRKIVVLLLLLSVIAPFLPAWHGRAETATTIFASGDSYVDKGYPTKILGGRSRMRADHSPVKIAYLRFPSTCPSGCSLSIYSDADLSNGPRVYTTRNFSESTLNWNSQPVRGVLVADFGPIRAGWNTVKLKSTTARVFRLEADSSTQLSIYSREGDRSRRAKLVTGGSTTAPSPTPTAAATAPNPTATGVPTQPSPDGGNITFPVRAAFYYPWFPKAWTQGGIYPYSKYEPTLGYYDGSDPVVISAQIDAMLYGGITVGIASWWGQGHHTDQRVPALLQQAAGTGFKWAFYYEPEGNGNPSQEQLASDLNYLVTAYGSNPNAARVDGRLVIFVYNANDLDCSVVDRYRAANTAGAYIVLKVFTGYRSCAAQPDGWHQYAPAAREDGQVGYSYAISPSFDKVGETTRLARDTAAWPQTVRNMVASGAPWQLVTTFNEWGEGTGVESSKQYPSSSGYGYYLDVLHSNGGLGADQIPTATTTVAPTQVAPTATVPPVRPPETSGFTVGAVGDIMHETSTTAFQRTDQVCQLASQDDLFLALGDIQYENGAYSLFLSRYDASTCGTIKAKTKPVPGNHEYLTAGASGYYQYFGSLAGDPAKGYYSFTAGNMHFIAINSNCSQISGGCGTTGSQYAFIKADLAANPTGCTVAFWHHPRYSSGQHGDNAIMDPIWDLFANNGGDVVLAGHDHTYERFAPIDASGTVGTGVRSFVVGTGGKNSTAVSVVKSGSQVRITNVFGILRLSSDGSSYSWQFVGVDGTVQDSGTSACVNAPTVEIAEVSATSATTATAAPTATPVRPTNTPDPTITPVPTSTPHPTSTAAATETPTVEPTIVPTEVPTQTPVDTPAAMPSSTATDAG